MKKDWLVFELAEGFWTIGWSVSHGGDEKIFNCKKDAVDHVLTHGQPEETVEILSQDGPTYGTVRSIS